MYMEIALKPFRVVCYGRSSFDMQAYKVGHRFGAAKFEQL